MTKPQDLISCAIEFASEKLDFHPNDVEYVLYECEKYNHRTVKIEYYDGKEISQEPNGFTLVNIYLSEDESKVEQVSF